MLTVGVLSPPPWVSVEEISSRSEFADREMAVRPLRVVYANYSRLEHHGIVVGGVAVALTRGLSWVAEPDRSEEKSRVLAAIFRARGCGLRRV